MAGASSRCGVVYDPSTGRQSRNVAFGGRAEVDRAVAAAAEMFPEWAASPPLRRARVLNRFRGLIERDQKKLARIITSEHGKVLSDAMGEVQRGLEVVESVSRIPQLLTAGSGGWNHAIQFSRHGFSLDVGRLLPWSDLI